jgi:hypothetical protein
MLAWAAWEQKSTALSSCMVLRRDSTLARPAIMALYTPRPSFCGSSPNQKSQVRKCSGKPMGSAEFDQTDICEFESYMPSHGVGLRDV